MSKIKMVMFDLSGTTVYDDTGVRDCLYKAAVEFKLKTTPEEILLHMGTNKIHLYQYLIARSRGKNIDFRDFEKIQDPKALELATKVFHRYEEIMIAHYRNEVKEVPGAADTFRWCHANGIKVATDTGFHRQITQAIMDGMGWVRDGLVDISVDVEHAPNERGNHDFAPYRMPTAETRAAQLQVAGHVGLQRCGNGRNALGHQVRRHLSHD